MGQIKQQVRLLISFRCLIARRALFFTFTGFHGLVIDRITAGIFENIYRNDVNHERVPCFDSMKGDEGNGS